MRFELDLAAYQLRQGGPFAASRTATYGAAHSAGQRRGELVTRDEIAARLWDKNLFVDVDQSINRAVRKLRLAFRDDPDHPRYLETVVGKGYRFIGPIEIAGKSHASATLQQNIPALWGQELRTHHATLFRLLVTAIVFLAIGSGAWFGPRFWKPRQAGVAIAAPIRSLAVLPFENLSGTPEQDYFADGFTDELTTELARTTSLRVISRTSAMHYKTSHASLPQTAQELGVDVIVEGSVVRRGDEVRITAQLIRASNDTHLWAKTYQRTARDFMGLQAEVAGRLPKTCKKH